MIKTNLHIERSFSNRPTPTFEVKQGNWDCLTAIYIDSGT